jgi:hypothetical protein
MSRPGIIQDRVICPYCTAEVAKGYLSLHKKLYCPMRPARQEDIIPKAMGSFKPRNAAPGYNSGSVITPSIAGGTPPTDLSFTDNIYEIDLNEEYDMVTKKIEPKKDEEQIDYQCGACNGKFDTLLKYCPHCGTELAGEGS